MGEISGGELYGPECERRVWDDGDRMWRTNANNQQHRTLTREELHQRVWANPVMHVAAALGLSDRGLAKICDRHRIPTPGRGYWQRLRSGKRVRRKPLPELFLKEAHLATINLPSRASRKDTEEVSERAKEQEHVEARPENRIVVPERIGRSHPLVVQTRKALEGKRRTKSTENRLDVDVEPGSVRRALRIMNALIWALEQRGFAVEISKEKDYPTLVWVHGTAVAVRLAEIYDRFKLPREEPHSLWQRWERKGTGRLALKLVVSSWHTPGLRKTWADGKKQRVEHCLNGFIVGLVRVAERRREHLRELEEQRRRWEEERRAREERARRRREEEARIEELGCQVEDWEEARRVRAYLAVLRDAVAAHGPAEDQDDLEAWIRWADEYASRIDPLAGLKEVVERVKPRLRREEP